MATASSERLQKELSCSLCHEYFTEPVCIHCGHNFCQVCIIRFWREQEADFSCPQCGEISATRELRPNRELGVVAATVKQLKFEAPESAGGAKLCEVHQKPLELFCKEEGKLLCPGCAESEEHAASLVVPAEEAAEDYKQKLQIHLETLIEERKKVLDFQTKTEDRNKEFLEKVEGEKQKIVSKFEELQRYLREQKKVMLDQLDDLVKTQEKVATRLSREISVFDALIREVKEKYKQPAWVFLQDVVETSNRFTMWEFQQPPDISSELEEKLCAISKNYLIMQAIMEEFKEAFPQDASVKWVKVTLDPDVAGYNLNVSSDQKILRLSLGESKSYPYLLQRESWVLGCERFTSGRHYWEVKVGEEANWAVGVAKESVKWQGELNLDEKESAWFMRKPSTFLYSGNIPETVGIFLDYKLNRVMFFDSAQGKVLCILRPCSLLNVKLHPFFSLTEQKYNAAEEECYIQLCS